MAKLILFLCIAFVAAVIATRETNEIKDTCSPLFGYCLETSQCCRNLICLSYAAKCISLPPGQVIPGDDRPIGPPSDPQH